MNAYQAPSNRPKAAAGRHLVFFLHRAVVIVVNRSTVVNFLHDVGYDCWGKSFGVKVVGCGPTKVLEDPFAQVGQLTLYEPDFAFPFFQQGPGIVSREVLFQAAKLQILLNL